MPVRLVALLAILAALAVTSPGSATRGAMPPATIAFTGEHGPCRPLPHGCADARVFLAGPGDRLRQISPRGEQARALSWSPDGSLLLVCRGLGCARGTFTMDLRGRFGDRPIASGAFQAPAWAPDGSRLAFADHEGVWTVSTRTRERHEIVSRAWIDWLHGTRLGWGVSGLCWSHDGSRVVFAAVRGAAAMLFAVRADSADPAEPMLLYRSRRSAALSPSCSPTSPTVAFGEARDALGRQMTISTVRLDGTRLRRLVDGSAPLWSPDGSTIAFDRTMAGGVATMRPDGSRVRALGCACSTSSLSWAPDGTRLAYAGAVGVRGGAIYTLDLDGSGGARAALLLDHLTGAPLWRPRH